MSFDLYFAGSPNLELDKYMMNKGCCRLQSQLNESNISNNRTNM